MSQVISLRLPDITADRLKVTARRTGRSLNEVSSRSLEEWLRQEEFADVEFRSFNGERHACLKAGIPIWQLIMVAREYGMNLAKTAEHIRFPTTRVKAGLNYYMAHPEEIDTAISDNDAMSFETLKRLLPELEGISIPEAVLTGAAG